MHSRLPAAAHLVPVVARQLQLGAHRHAHLRERDQVVEPRFAGDFLRQEPAHLRQRGPLRQPGKKWIALPRPGPFQLFEPRDEALRIGRGRDRLCRHRCALLFDKSRFHRHQPGICAVVRSVGKGRPQTLLRKHRQLQVKLVRVHSEKFHAGVASAPQFMPLHVGP